MTRRPLLIIVLSTLLCVAAAVALILTTPRTYEARSSIFVQKDNKGFDVPSGLMSALLAKSGDPENYAMTVLESETFARKLVDRLGLARDRDFNPSGKLGPETAAAALMKSVKARQDGRGLIALTVTATSATLAARIANAYLTEFMATVDSRNRRKRMFTDTKIRELKAELTALESRLKELSQERSIINLPEQTRAAISYIAGLEQQLQSVDLQLVGVESQLLNVGVLSQLADLRARKEALLAQQTRLQDEIDKTRQTMGEFPEAALEQARLQREIDLKTKLFETVSQQHQLALIDEQADLGAYQIIDRATVPRYPIKPRPRLYLAVAVLLGVGIGVAINLLLVPDGEVSRS